MSKPISKAWTFTSDSNPDKTYQTLQYEDGTTSCNCRGWTLHVTTLGHRSCKHTRAVDMGTADDTCASAVNYGEVKTPVGQNVPSQQVEKVKTAVKQTTRRKIEW